VEKVPLVFKAFMVNFNMAKFLVGYFLIIYPFLQIVSSNFLTFPALELETGGTSICFKKKR
jgi:hypothetical protein